MATYYTPTVHEMHVGLDCELLKSVTVEKKVKTEVWEMVYISDPSVLADVFAKRNEDIAIRIKMIDAKDLKSLGFDVTIDHPVRICADKKNVAIDIVDGTHAKLSYYITSAESIEPQHNVVRVELNNRQELKKILRQLKLLYEPSGMSGIPVGG